MLTDIAYLSFLGLPLVAWTGILTLLLILFTATIGFLNYKGNHIIPFKWHLWIAALTIGIAFIHIIFILSAYLGY